jgi:hypothetical protein
VTIVNTPVQTQGLYQMPESLNSTDSLEYLRNEADRATGSGSQSHAERINAAADELEHLREKAERFECLAAEIRDALDDWAEWSSDWKRHYQRAQALLAEAEARPAPLPEGVTVVGLEDPAALHSELAKALGEQP